MSSDTAVTYPESVASWGPPTPATPTPPPPPPPPAPPAAAAHRAAPVRRQFDFAGGGELEQEEEEDDDEFLCRAADEIERSYSEAKSHAPLCVCGRGVCAVERDAQRGRWKYVCPTRPKCKHVTLYEDIDVNPKSQPALNIHPKTSNAPVLSGSNNHMVGARTGISPQDAAVTRPNYVSPQGAHATTPGNQRPRDAGAAAPGNVSPQGAHTTIPGNQRPRGAGAAAPGNVSPQGARSNGSPICLCGAGECIKSTQNGIEYYVCRIRKGQGACRHKVPVNTDAEETPQTGDNNRRGNKHLEDNPVEKEADGNNPLQLGDNNANGLANPAQPGGDDDEWGFNIVNNDIVLTAKPAPYGEIHQESPCMLRQSIPVVKTPERSPMPPKGTCSPITPSSDVCFRCHEKGHWSKDCPKPSACHQCGVVGHWMCNCPQLHK